MIASVKRKNKIRLTKQAAPNPQGDVRQLRVARSIRSGVTTLTWVLANLCWISSLAARENEYPVFRIGGLLFGDLYYVASHHTDQGEGAKGMVLRRGYLTFDADFSQQWFGRLRFELNQSGKFETYTSKVSVKDLYAGWKLGRHRLLFGLSPTPTFDLIESIWSLRYLARTPMDLQGVASRDTGVSGKGPLNTAGTLSYRVMVGSGLEFGNETGDGWKWMGALTWKPWPHWTLDLYLDYERLVGPSNRATFQIFGGYRSDLLSWGFQYSHQDRQEDPRLQLASAFVVSRLDQKTALVGRVDRIIEPSPRGDNISYLPFDPSAPATFFIGGVEYRVLPHLLITPNTVVIVYDRNERGIRPGTDFHLRLTLFLNLEK